MCHIMIDLGFSDIQLLLLAVAEALEIVQVFCAVQLIVLERNLGQAWGEDMSALGTESKQLDGAQKNIK